MRHLIEASRRAFITLVPHVIRSRFVCQEYLGQDGGSRGECANDFRTFLLSQPDLLCLELVSG